MQFPVPQFTDVEDKIFGPLTLKQFGILFVAGVIIFAAFSVTKNILVTIFFALLVGLPAGAVAFGKVNGRPVYNTFGYLVKFYVSPKVLVFHKEASSFGIETKLRKVEIAQNKQEESLPPPDPKARLKEVQGLLAKQAEEERQLVDSIKR